MRRKGRVMMKIHAGNKANNFEPLVTYHKAPGKAVVGKTTAPSPNRAPGSRRRQFFSPKRRDNPGAK